MKGFPHLCPTATWRRQTGGTQHDQQGDQAPRWESIDVARVRCDRAGLLENDGDERETRPTTRGRGGTHCHWPLLSRGTRATATPRGHGRRQSALCREIGTCTPRPRAQAGQSHTHLTSITSKTREIWDSGPSGILDRSCGKKIITIPSESRFHVTRISYRYRKGIIRYHIVYSRVATRAHASASRSSSCK